MCDNELLVDYLYGELMPHDREAFDRHLTSCATCRDEVDGLRGTRTSLALWAPPEPELGFEVVRSRRPAPGWPARFWGWSPAFGLAAAAMLIGAVSAAIANVEVTTGAGGITVTTGWNRAAAVQTHAASSSGSSAELQRVEARLRELESQLAAVRSEPAAVPVAASGRMPEAEVMRMVRQLIAQSEERQQGVLARQILQVNRDFEVARRTDLDRLGQGMQQIQRMTVDTFQRQKAYEDHLIRVGMQR
jgi:hypothetical protein